MEIEVGSGSNRKIWQYVAAGNLIFEGAMAATKLPLALLIGAFVFMLTMCSCFIVIFAMVEKALKRRRLI